MCMLCCGGKTAQNCSFFTPTTALSLEITFEKPEVGVPCLPAELSQKYRGSFVFGFGGVFLVPPPPPFPLEDVEITANTCLAH